MYGPAFFNADLGLFKNFQFKESKKLQLRFNAYNFLNHPLWSFNGSNLSLGFDGTTGKVNTPSVRHRHTKAGPSCGPGRNQVLLLIPGPQKPERAHAQGAPALPLNGGANMD